MIGSGSVMGGFGSMMAGGKFMDGFKHSLISSALNHAGDIVVQKIQDAIQKGQPQQEPQKKWDLNGDGKLQKKEADIWWLYGNGENITIDGNLIDLKGFKIEKANYSSENDIYCYDTVDVFRDLPLETSSTYGGSCFRIVNGKPQMLSQDYHYDMQQNNSFRNALTKIGRPRIPKGVTPNNYIINIQY